MHVTIIQIPAYGREKYEPAELHARQVIADGTNSVTQELAFSISAFKAA
jgi:hypothetical protein